MPTRPSEVRTLEVVRETFRSNSVDAATASSLRLARSFRLFLSGGAVKHSSRACGWIYRSDAGRFEQPGWLSGCNDDWSEPGSATTAFGQESHRRAEQSVACRLRRIRLCRPPSHGAWHVGVEVRGSIRPGSSKGRCLSSRTYPTVRTGGWGVMAPSSGFFRASTFPVRPESVVPALGRARSVYRAVGSEAGSSLKEVVDGVWCICSPGVADGSRWY